MLELKVSYPKLNVGCKLTTRITWSVIERSPCPYLNPKACWQDVILAIGNPSVGGEINLSKSLDSEQWGYVRSMIDEELKSPRIARIIKQLKGAKAA